MNLYKHILVATNLSEASKKVTDRAKTFADSISAELTLIHVIEFNPAWYSGSEFAVPLNGDIEKSISQHAKFALNAEATRLNLDTEHQLLKIGITLEQLVKTIEECKIDLLVLGYHEHNWLASALGSTSNSILHHMPCDIMAVYLSS